MRIFGLIGKSLSHSFSADYFREKFLRENVQNCEYRLLPLDCIEDLMPLIHSMPDLCGLNVTIPYKQSVIKYLSSCDEISSKIGAVNTLKISRANNSIQLAGFNSDAPGFLYSLLNPHHYKKALILGTGGAAQTINFILTQWGIECLHVSRNPKNYSSISYNQLNQTIIEEHTLIINTTPLGMFPKIDDCPPIPYRHLSSQHFIYDLIYNPEETLLLQKAKACGTKTQNGALMLELQAERSWEIWNS